MKTIISIALLVGFSSLAVAADNNQRIQPTATQWLAQTSSNHDSRIAQLGTDSSKSARSERGNTSSRTDLLGSRIANNSRHSRVSRHGRFGSSKHHRFGHSKRKIYGYSKYGRFGHHKKRIFSIKKNGFSKRGRIGSRSRFGFTNRGFGHRSSHGSFGFSKFGRHGFSGHRRH